MTCLSFFLLLHLSRAPAFPEARLLGNMRVVHIGCKDDHEKEKINSLSKICGCRLAAN